VADPAPSWRVRFRRWRRHWLRDPALAALNYPLLYLVRCLPTERGSHLGAIIGTINGRWRYPAIRVRIKKGYVHLTGAQMSEAELDRLVDRLFANTGRTMLEFALLYRLWDEGRVEIDAAPLLAARAQNRPVVCVGLHLGNWEILGVALAGMGIPFTSFYQPPVSRFEHKIAVQARQSYGARLFPPDLAGTRAALRLLTEERGVLGIYGDEERRGYVFAPLFGRKPAPHANLVAAVRLAMASDAALIPCYVERLEGTRFRAVYMAPVELLPGKESLDENIQRLDRAITAPILAHLDQWYSLMDYYRPERF
jgi:lauroyl/myristoyl acyltransferase